MKNTLSDLNNHLFAQLERLGDEDLKGENLEEEIKRAETITKVSSQIIANGALVVKAMQVHGEYGRSEEKLKMLEGCYHG